jgi:hypothetical protein
MKVTSLTLVTLSEPHACCDKMKLALKYDYLFIHHQLGQTDLVMDVEKTARFEFCPWCGEKVEIEHKYLDTINNALTWGDLDIMLDWLDEAE